jgi:predicted ribonuclease YlaK
MASPLLEAQRVVRDLVRLELDQRVADFEDAIKTLQSHRQRWKDVGDLLVLDTNFYVEHPTELKDTDLGAVTVAQTPGSRMHVLVPMLVVDELDRLKRDNQARSRARTALKMLDEVFKRISKESPMGRLRREDNTTHSDGSLGLGEVTMELLFDPPDHVRLPNNDDEIVDRAVAVQALAGRPVTMVTYDKGMSLRARYAGLQEMWLPHP